VIDQPPGDFPIVVTTQAALTGDTRPLFQFVEAWPDPSGPGFTTERFSVTRGRRVEGRAFTIDTLDSSPVVYKICSMCVISITRHSAPDLGAAQEERRLA